MSISVRILQSKINCRINESFAHSYYPHSIRRNDNRFSLMLDIESAICLPSSNVRWIGTHQRIAMKCVFNMFILPVITTLLSTSLNRSEIAQHFCLSSPMPFKLYIENHGIFALIQYTSVRCDQHLSLHLHITCSWIGNPMCHIHSHDSIRTFGKIKIMRDSSFDHDAEPIQRTDFISGRRLIWMKSESSAL